MKPQVAIVRGDEKLALVAEVAAASGFWDHLEQKRAASGKSKADFLIAIKINLMILMTAEVKVVATEADVVEEFIRLLRDQGYTNIKVVESQNTMGNWVKNRSVKNVARVAGYKADVYEIVDLTLEKQKHTYKVRGLPDWKNFVGRTWAEADYRIDFAKFKSQVDNFFTLCLKNQFGILPLQNKYWHYHTRLPYWACTLYTLVNFPVDFGFIDGYWGSDGTAGFAIQYHPKLLKLMLASEDILALDLVGAKLMGIDAWESPLPRFVMQHMGEPEYEIIGDATPLENWTNVSDDIQNIVDVAQAVYVLSNLGATAGLLNVDVDEFPPRFFAWRFYYWVMNRVFAYLAGVGLTWPQTAQIRAQIMAEGEMQKFAAQAEAQHHHRHGH